MLFPARAVGGTEFEHGSAAADVYTDAAAVAGSSAAGGAEEIAGGVESQICEEVFPLGGFDPVAFDPATPSELPH